MNTAIKAGIVIALLIAAAGILALKNWPQSSATAEPTAVESPKPAPASASLPRLLDLGAGKCIPCKMMAPILEKLDKAYRGKAMIIYLDVRYHREKAIGFGINGIPTQIFFDKNGKEVYRHIGFMNEAAIVAQFKKMGVE